MGIEPILPKKRDFESRVSTNSTTPACREDEREFAHFVRIVKSMRELMWSFFCLGCFWLGYLWQRGQRNVDRPAMSVRLIGVVQRWQGWYSLS